MIYCIHDDGDDTGSSAILHDGLDKLVLECLYSGFIGAKENESGGDNWSYKTCKAPVRSPPPEHQYSVFTGSTHLPTNSVKQYHTNEGTKQPKQHCIKKKCRHRQHVSDVEIATAGIQQTFTIKILRQL